MSAITASAVKELRELSGAGMMDAKKALEETNGDIEAAVDLLRAKGLATAAKKSSRTAAEGLVGVAVEGTKGTAIEVNSQTDFVAKNEQFQEFVAAVSQVALGLSANEPQAVLSAPYGGGETVQERLTNNIATIGENQVIRRVKSLSVSNGRVMQTLRRLMALASSWRCTSLLHSRCRLTNLALIPKRLSVSAVLRVKRPRKAASQRILSKRWLKAP